MFLRDFELRARVIARILRSAGPYLLIELVMPGGTLIALALLYFRRKGNAPIGRQARRLAEQLVVYWRQLVVALNPRVIGSV